MAGVGVASDLLKTASLEEADVARQRQADPDVKPRQAAPPGLALGLRDEEPGKAPAPLRWIHREAPAIEPAIAFVPEQQRYDCGSAQKAGPSARRDQAAMLSAVSPSAEDGGSVASG